MSTPEDPEPTCFCGLPAKLRVSRTSKNPFRLFYNCPKCLNDQCSFFCWFDEPAPTGDRHINEVNLIRYECTQLLERSNEILLQHDDERIVWEREKSELRSRLSAVRSELKEIKRRIRRVNESDLMPPLDKLSIDEPDDALVIHMV